jgi:hypothetical protein
MNFYEMNMEQKIMFLLEGHNDPYFRRNNSHYSIMTTPQNILGSIALQIKEDGCPRPKNEEILEIVKDMYCTFSHTGGYNRYHNFLKTRKYSRFSSISACTVEQFVSYKGRQVPNSEVKFFKSAQEAIKEVNK